MEKRHYKCHYCRKKYVPNKRRTQKYCSASCRSKAFHLRQSSKKKGMEIQVSKPGLGKPASKDLKIEKMSLAGVGNATAGVLAVNVLTKIMTPNNNKPATKGDINRIEEKLSRFHRISNLPGQSDGSLPYFDIETKTLIYFKGTPIQ